MKGYLRLPSFAALALTGLVLSLPLRAQENPPKPGTLLTVAGSPGKVGFSGDGGPATQALLDTPLAVVTDEAGNLFVADGCNARVRRVSPDGTITTVAGRRGSGSAGNCSGGFSGDGGPATQALFGEVGAVVVDPAGDLFISDLGNDRVRKVDAAGILTTVAGDGHPADSVGDGGPATKARLAGPVGLAVDPMGNLLIVDRGNQRVRKVDTSGIITTVAGGGHPADGRGDGGLATDAHLTFPLHLALDQAGSLYISDPFDYRVRRVSPDGRITTVAGGGSPADGVGDGGRATEACLDGADGLAVDGGGNLFIAENHGVRIRKVSAEGIITTVAGTGEVGYTGDGGPATAARLKAPTAVCIDRAGNLIFTEGNLYTLAPKPGAPLNFTITLGNMLVREVIGVGVPR
jgi:hypothetical protein